MPISITCPGCEKKLNAPDSAVGKKVRCPSCNAIVPIPKPDDLVEPDDFVEPEPETAVSETPVKPKKKAAWDNKDAEPEEFEKPEPDTAVSETPTKSKKKAAWDKKGGDAEEASDKDADDYGFDENDEAERKRRKKKEKRRREEEDDFGDMRPRRRGEAHRGVLILVLGIVSLLGACLCAIIGWGLGAAVVNMANTDLAKMDNGAMDRTGRGMTTAGKACAIIGVGMGLINVILGIAIRQGAFNK